MLSHTLTYHTNLLHTRNYEKNSKPLFIKWFFFAILNPIEKFLVYLSSSIKFFDVKINLWQENFNFT